MIEKIEPNYSQQDFDSSRYVQVIQRYDEALNAVYISIDQSRELAHDLQGNIPLFQASLATPHFEQTFGFIDRLTRKKMTGANRDFVMVIPSFARDTLQDINRHIQRKPETYLLPSYRLAQKFAHTPQVDLARITTDIYAANLDRLLQAREINDVEAFSILRHIIATADEIQIRSLVRAVRQPGSSFAQRFSKPMDSIIDLSILGPNSFNRPARMLSVLNEFTDERGEELLEAWDDSIGRIRVPGKGSEQKYFENFGVMCQLEKRRPGITKFLIDTYGVYNFSRYPVDLLVDQYDSRDERDVPYGVYATARHDHNTAMYGFYSSLASVYPQFKQKGMKIKVFESEVSDDLGAILNIAPKSAALHGKIDFMIIGAHELGNAFSEVDGYRNTFSDSSRICLISCSTGEKNGTAQVLSRQLPDLDVHSPEYIAYLKENGIVLEQVNGRVRPKVLFGYTEGNYTKPSDLLYPGYNLRTGVEVDYDVATRVYRNGALIDDYVK